jgi:tetratricopeptide (TPR) repeat protein
MNAPQFLLAAVMLAGAGQSEPPASLPVPVPSASPGVERAPAPTEPAASEFETLLARADAAWMERDLPGKLEEMGAALDAAAKGRSPTYPLLWRQARLLGWRSEDPGLTKKEKSRLGKLAWDLGDQARALEPGKPEGHFFAMVGVGNYSLGIGVFSALGQGIEGKFKERLSRAEAIEPGFQGGAIPMSWGRFYFELPWPKHDVKRSEKHLRDAIALNGENVRAWIYLGDLLLDEGRKDEARAAWQRALAIAVVPGQGDPPEQRRWQVVARQSLEKLGSK